MTERNLRSTNLLMKRNHTFQSGALVFPTAAIRLFYKAFDGKSIKRPISVSNRIQQSKEIEKQKQKQKVVNN